jgi:hypothetical protein
VSATPIFDQLAVETAGAALRRAYLEAVDRVTPALLRMATALAPSAPEDVLEAIRRDQATLDWQEAWRAERETAAAAVEAFVVPHPPCDWHQG